MKSFTNIFSFIIFLFSLINNSLQSSYIVFPFKKSVKETKYYPEDLLQNDLEITMEIGTPPQSIGLNLRSKAYTFFVTSVQANLPFTTFNDYNSQTLIKMTQKPDTYMNQEYTKGYMIYESIYINGKEIKNISLIMATSVTYRESGALGLRLVESHEYGDDLSFIYQMKTLGKLDSYSYMINYKSDDEGDLIIGTYPHLFDNKFSEKNFYYTRAGAKGNNVNWILDFDIIRYNNKTINLINKQGFTNIEFGLIQAPYKLKQYFKENFYGDKCVERYNKKRDITIIHCDEKFDITSFKNLTFILKDISFEFTLTYEDLFIKYNNEYIFGIVFDENVDNKEATWILGKPFMKKYNLIYDLDKKIIGLYKGYNEEEKNDNQRNLVYIILLIVLGVIVVALVAFIIYYLKKPRKNRAYELNDDNYEYFPNNEIVPPS